MRGEGGDSCAHQSHVCLGTGLDGGEASFVRHCDAGDRNFRVESGVLPDGRFQGLARAIAIGACRANRGGIQERIDRLKT